MIVTKKTFEELRQSEKALIFEDYKKKEWILIEGFLFEYTLTGNEEDDLIKLA